MTEIREPEVEPYFSQPKRQITSMLIVLALVIAGIYVGLSTIASIFWSNPYLNGLIGGVWVLGVLSCFGQVVQLVSSVRWIKRFARDQQTSAAPVLLAPLATLLRSRGARMQLSSTSTKSILDSVGSRIDEDREITKYLGNTLIFLGLLGTFYGLATTVPALVQTIRSLSDDGQGGDIFAKLQVGLEAQLGGMGTAFSSSLLGLAGSLIVGLLELFAGHGQNRFYRELEEWLSSITRLGFASGDDTGGSDAGAYGGVLEQMVEQMDMLTVLFEQTQAAQAQTDSHIVGLTQAVTTLAHQLQQDDPRPAMIASAEAQQRLVEKLRDSGVDGIDAESRMRLRSIDVQLLRILEELSAGRQETLADLRTELSAITRALRQSARRNEQG